MGDLTMTDLQMVKREQCYDLLRNNLVLTQKGMYFTEFLLRIYRLAKKRNDTELLDLVSSAFKVLHNFRQIVDDVASEDKSDKVVSIHTHTSKKVFNDILEEFVAPVRLAVFQQFFDDLKKVANTSTIKLMKDYEELMAEFTEMAKQTVLNKED